MNIGICKLCEQQKKLINKSHIIPRQFHHYTTREVENHFGSDNEPSKGIYIYSQDGKEKQSQNGLYVGGILCEDCENWIERDFPVEFKKFILKPNAPLPFPIKKYKESPEYLELRKWANSIPEKSI